MPFTIENKLCSYFKTIKKWFTKIEDHLIGFSNPKSTTGNVTPDSLNKDLLKNQFSELEK